MPSAVAKNEHQVLKEVPWKITTPLVTYAKSRHEPFEHWRYSSQLVNPTSPALPLGRPQHCPYPGKAMKNLPSQCLDVPYSKIDLKNQLIISTSTHRVSSSSHSPILRHPGAALGLCPAVASPPATCVVSPAVSGVASGAASRCRRGSAHRRPPSM